MTLAFTRPLRRLDESVKMAESMGFSVIAAPSLDIISAEQSDFKNLRQLFADGAYDLAAFASPTAAEECLRYWGDDMKNILEGVSVVAIGPGTGSVLLSSGIAVNSIPSEYSSSGLAEHIINEYGSSKIVIIRSDKGSDVLTDALSNANINADEFVAYKLNRIYNDHRRGSMIDAAKNGNIDVFAFTSPLSAECFMDEAGADVIDMMNTKKVAAIGKPTASTLSNRGVRVDVIPDKATFECMLRSILKKYEVL